MDELRIAIAAGLLPSGVNPPGLGQIITGRHPGRLAEGQMTICDFTGTGAQDTAISTHALAAAQAAGVGSAMRA